ncbi:MAG: hypothetical protein AB7R40_23765 [Nitrospiraceae bacterium]
MTSTNDLYLKAVGDMVTGTGYGVARHSLNSGDTLICSVKGVAGRSITRKHMRTTYLLLADGAEYSKPISRAKAAELLKASA